MSKKASHVGIMLSFVVFVIFLYFIFSMIYPVTKTQKDKEFILDYLKTAFVEKISEDLTIVSVKVSEIEDSCFTIDKKWTGWTVVKDEGEIKFNSHSDSSSSEGEIQIQGSEGFYKIYLSEKFENGNSISECGKSVYEIGLVNEERYVFVGNIQELQNFCNGVGDYENLKQELNIPEDTEFCFLFEDISSCPEDFPTTNIYSEDVPIVWFDKDADINSGFINIKIW